MKYLITTLCAASLTQAAMISINNIDPDAGTFSGFVVTAVNADTFTLIGTSDFDGGGVADTLSFELVRTTYATGTITGSDVAVGNVNTGGNTNNWYSNFGNAETLQLEITNVSYTSGEADGTTAVFDGFQGISRTNIDDTSEFDYLIHTGSVGSTTVSATSGTGIDLTSAGDSSVVFLTAAAPAAGVPGIRLRDLDLQFSTVVPEPSSVLLLGLGVLGLAARRTR